MTNFRTGTTIAVEHMKSGQQRRYGDCIYESKVTITGPTKYLPNEDAVVSLAKLIVHPFTHDARKDAADEIPWYAPRLSRVSNGDVRHDAETDTYSQEWVVYGFRPYLD